MSALAAVKRSRAGRAARVAQSSAVMDPAVTVRAVSVSLSAPFSASARPAPLRVFSPPASSALRVMEGRALCQARAGKPPAKPAWKAVPPAFRAVRNAAARSSAAVLPVRPAVSAPAAVASVFQ